MIVPAQRVRAFEARRRGRCRPASTAAGDAGLRRVAPPGQHGAPVIEVSGRTYPVEVRYRPIADPDRSDEEPRDQAQAICDAVDELSAAGPGDILVFLSGEREIRDTADALRDRAGPPDRPGALEVLPLYARLPAAEQYRVFQPHRGGVWCWPPTSLRPR